MLMFVKYMCMYRFIVRDVLQSNFGSNISNFNFVYKNKDWRYI